MVKLALIADRVVDRAGNAMAERTDLFEFVHDTTGPSAMLTVAGIESGTPSKADYIDVSLAFSEAVTGLSESDFSISGGAIESGSLQSLDSTDSNYLVRVLPSDPDSSGDVRIALAADSVSDSVGLPNAASDVFVWTRDKQLPKPRYFVEEWLDADGNMPHKRPYLDGPVTVTVTADEPLSKSALIAGGDYVVIGGKLAEIEQLDDKTGWRFTINPDSSGALVVRPQAFVDLAGNQATSDVAFPFSYDVTPPEPIFATEYNERGLFDGQTVGGDPVLFSIRTEKVVGLGAEDFVISNAEANDFEVGGTFASFTLTPLDDGEVVVTVKEDSFQDSAGNLNKGGRFSYFVDRKPPMPAISSSAVESGGSINNAPLRWSSNWARALAGLPLKISI